MGFINQQTSLGGTILYQKVHPQYPLKPPQASASQRHSARLLCQMQHLGLGATCPLWARFLRQKKGEAEPKMGEPKKHGNFWWIVQYFG